MPRYFSATLRAFAVLWGLVLCQLPENLQASAFALSAALTACALLCFSLSARGGHAVSLTLIPCALAAASVGVSSRAAGLPDAAFLDFVRPEDVAPRQRRADYARAIDVSATIRSVGRSDFAADLKVEAIRERPALRPIVPRRPRATRAPRTSEFMRGSFGPGDVSGRRGWKRRRASHTQQGNWKRERSGAAPGRRRAQEVRSRQQSQPRRSSAWRAPGPRAPSAFRESFTRVVKSVDSARPIPVQLKLTERKLWPGCVVSLRLFGRALPRFTHRGFVVRASTRYHVRAVACPDPPPLRARLSERVRRALTSGHFAGAHGSALAGMLLGNSGELSYEARSGLSQLGVMHLFAASGLHMMLLFAAVRLLVSACFGPMSRTTLAVSLGMCFAYLWLLDFPVSLSRAFLFVAIYSLARALGRGTSSVDVFWATVLVLLGVMPRALFSLSGLLSCSAVAAIFFAATPLTRLAETLGLRFASSTIAVGAAALAGTTPIVLSVFGSHSFAAILANAVLVPLAGLLLPCGLALGALSLVPGLDSVVQMLSAPVAWVAFAFYWLAEACVPLALWARACSVVTAVAFAGVALVFVGVWGYSLRNRSQERWPRLPRCAACLGIALLGPGGACLVDAIQLARFFFQ